MNNNIAHILAATGLSSDQRAELIFEMGEVYLDTNLAGDSEGREILAYSKTFWAWWLNYWLRREHEFIMKLHELADMPKEAIAIEYKSIHEPCELRFYPGNHIFMIAKKETACQKA